MDRYVNNTIL